MHEHDHIIGIDEAGRGPLAGPLAVGAVCLHDKATFRHLVGVADSKILTPQARCVWSRRIMRLADEGSLSYFVTFISSQKIDEWGMGRALKVGVERVLARLSADEDTDIRLDGSLKAPHVFTRQQTIIQGDMTEPVISAASVMAKVTRDAYMRRMGTRFPEYGFEKHKGYGTPAHRVAIAKNGLSSIHRVSFCSHIL